MSKRPDLPYWRSLFRLRTALPSDHGSWVFLLSPLLIGLFASGRLTAASSLLIIGLLAAFLLRQPVSIAVKVYSGRRSHAELPAARFWILVYSIISLSAFTGLLLWGNTYLLYLAIPGLVVFAWHLWLVSRRQERRKPGVEILGSGVLALSAPAAYWVGRGALEPTGWLLFGLAWMQSAASIVYAYLRLEQRELKSLPALPRRLQMARRALLYTSFNLLVTIGLATFKQVPVFLFIPYAIQWIESIYGALRPAIGVKPTRIGLRQLAISTLFTICFILIWSAN